MSILIKNATIVTPTAIIKNDILIEGSRIKKIGNCANHYAEEVIDAQGKTVLAGFVDMHCHLRTPGFEYKESFDSGCAAAIAGGYTSIACMPNTMPAIDNAATVNFIVNKAAETDLCKVYPIGAITKGQKGEEITEMGFMREAGAIAVSDDGRPVESAAVMRNALEYAKSHDMLVISHCEELGLSEGGLVNEGFNATISGLKGIPKCAEEIGIMRDVLLAEAFNARIHIAHVSTALGVDIIRQAKKRGVQVTAETCPHYFSATDEEILSYNTFAKINPPLREETDITAIIEGLRDGTIDAIATDHAPHGADEKRQEFAYAPFGTVGLETAFAIAYTHLVASGEMDLVLLSKLMSARPAQILGIGSGCIAENETADLVIVDLDASYVIDAKQFKSKGHNSVFNGWHVRGRILNVIVDGEIKL